MFPNPPTGWAGLAEEGREQEDSNADEDSRLQEKDSQTTQEEPSLHVQGPVPPRPRLRPPPASVALPLSSTFLALLEKAVESGSEVAKLEYEPNNAQAQIRLQAAVAPESTAVDVPTRPTQGEVVASWGNRAARHSKSFCIPAHRCPADASLKG